MNVLFDMDVGDSDDFITLLLLLNNPDVQVRGITCYQGSALEVGLINHVLHFVHIEDVLVGGWNFFEPTVLPAFFTQTVGKWKSEKPLYNPGEVCSKILKMYPDTQILTTAPLTNLQFMLDNLYGINIKSVTTQGGYLGKMVPNPLPKFANRSSYRTYNLGTDIPAFEMVNSSNKIEKLTYVTKDMCHGFIYTEEFHKTIKFRSSKISQLLKNCLSYYATAGKAMHDPLAMLIMLYPRLGQFLPIEMTYRIDSKGRPAFSSTQSTGTRYGVIDYDKKMAWQYFKQICEYKPIPKTIQHT